MSESPITEYWTLELVQALYPELSEEEANRELEDIRSMLEPF